MLKFENVSVSLGNKTILNGVEGQVGVGQFVALIGENGAGKSTLLHTLSGNLSYQGSVEFYQREMSTWDEEQLAIARAVLTQQFSLSFDFSVPELIAMGRHPYAETQLQCYERVSQYIELLDIAKLSERGTRTLSGGELQRVQMARCLAQLDAFTADSAGKLMLLDEPTSALDLRHQHRLLQLTKAFVKKGNSAIVVIHDLNLASLYADSIIILSQGKIVVQGEPKQVLTQHTLEQVYHTPMYVKQHPELALPMIFSEPQELVNEIASFK